MNENSDNVEKKNELDEAEVNVYCDCDKTIYIHCNHDCITGSSWVTTVF